MGGGGKTSKGIRGGGRANAENCSQGGAGMMEGRGSRVKEVGGGGTKVSRGGVTSGGRRKTLGGGGSEDAGTVCAADLSFPFPCLSVFALSPLLFLPPLPLTYLCQSLSES